MKRARASKCWSCRRFTESSWFVTLAIAGLFGLVIVIADDHPLVRHGLRQAIELESSFRGGGEAGDGQAALDLIETHQPHVVILDVNMSALDGFDGAYEIKRRGLKMIVVFLTFHSEE